MVSEFTNSQEVAESETKVNFKALYKLKDGLNILQLISFVSTVD